MLENKFKELVIIGGGPAGASAMLYAERDLIESQWFTGDLMEGQLPLTYDVNNYLGSTKISGLELLHNFHEHCSSFLENKEIKENIINYKIEKIEKKENGFLVTSELKQNKIYSVYTKNIIIATGASPKILEKISTLNSKFIKYCGLCDGFTYQKKDVIIVGGGNAAFEEAIYLKKIVKSITILIRSKPRALAIYQNKIKNEQKIKVIEKIEISSVKELKENKIQLILSNNQKLICDGIFVKIGFFPNTKLLSELNVNLDDNGYIKQHPTNFNSYETNVPGIYAVGDVRADTEKQITIAVDSAIKCILEIQKKIDN